MPATPKYDELPIRPDAPPGSAWGVWGEGDVLGCLNRVSAERTAAAAGLVRKGAVFALNLDYELPDPPLFGRAAPEHEVLGDGGHDDLLRFNTQSSSQWDGFRHIAGAHGHYNGVPDGEHGIHHWARRGIAARGVLVDIARARQASGGAVRCDDADAITVDELDRVLDAQGTTLEEGDVLLIRTGWLTWYRSLSVEGRTALAAGFRAPGVRPGVATARWLWDHGLAAVAADNPAFEVWPPGAHLSTDERRVARERGDAAEVFVHLALLPLLGLPIGELWDLDALADDCADDGVHEFFLTSAPLNVHAGVASPPNALAIK